VGGIWEAYGRYVSGWAMKHSHLQRRSAKHKKGGKHEKKKKGKQDIRVHCTCNCIV
jgi:hypothetical protein